jgi:hypothetical protein
LAANFQNHGSTVSRLLAVECAPALLASALIETDDQRAGLAAGQYDHLLAIDERSAGHSPSRQLRAEISGQVLSPNDFGTVDIETNEVSDRPQHIHAVAIDCGSGARTQRITDRVSGLVLVGPNWAAGVGVEGQDALHILVRHSVGDEHAAIGHGGAGIAGANLRGPHARQHAGFRVNRRQLIHNSCFAPHQIALQTAPLGPIVGARDGNNGESNAYCSER